MLLIPLMVFTSQIEMTLRASERSGLLTTTRVSWRWLELVLVIGVVVAIQRSALAVYAGKIAAALILVAFYVALGAAPPAFFAQGDRPAGLSRIAALWAAVGRQRDRRRMSLISIDRIMLKHMQGDYEGVGIFTIGCALAMQIGVLMNGPLMGAFDPVAIGPHGTDGAAKCGR